LRRDLEELQHLQAQFFSHPVIRAGIAGTLSEVSNDHASPPISCSLHGAATSLVAEMLRRGV